MNAADRCLRRGLGTRPGFTHFDIENVRLIMFFATDKYGNIDSLPRRANFYAELWGAIGRIVPILPNESLFQILADVFLGRVITTPPVRKSTIFPSGIAPTGTAAAAGNGSLRNRPFSDISPRRDR